MLFWSHDLLKYLWQPYIFCYSPFHIVTLFPVNWLSLTLIYSCNMILCHVFGLHFSERRCFIVSDLDFFFSLFVHFKYIQLSQRTKISLDPVLLSPTPSMHSYSILHLQSVTEYGMVGFHLPNSKTRTD